MNAIFSQSNMNTEFIPYFQVVNTNYMTWLHIAIIRLKDISDFFSLVPLSKNMFVLLRIYINTDVVSVTLSKTTVDEMLLSSNNSIFVNIC